MHTPFFPNWRPRLAALGHRVEQLRQQSLCHLELLLAPFLPPGLLSQADEGPNSRDRVFSVRRTFFGFHYQVLKPDTPCREIVRQIQALFALHEAGQVDENTSAYCQARKRLPLDTLCRLRVAAAAAGDKMAQRWHGLRPKVIDGTTVSAPDTPKNLRAYDLAVWSSHDGEDTLFNEFAQEARAGRPPWNVYFRVTLPDAIGFGLVDTINRVRGTKISAAQFLADCRARARDEGIFQQSYMCDPMGAAASHIVEWSAIERCKADYKIERVHLEADQVRERFGEFTPSRESDRERQIAEFLRSSFPSLFAINYQPSTINFRLGFDVAASGQGDLAAIYIDEAKGNELWLRGLFTCRTEDWHFLKTVLFHFLKHLHSVQGAGDESGLGRQICWEAAMQFSSRFLKVNLASKKHDLGFALMNQLSVAGKRLPRIEQDIAADYFALRKLFNGSKKWTFNEGSNPLNEASHCDIAWAGALATHAHTERKCSAGAAVVYDTGWFDGEDFHPYNSDKPSPSPEEAMLWSDDPRIWHRLG